MLYFTGPVVRHFILKQEAGETKESGAVQNTNTLQYI